MQDFYETQSAAKCGRIQNFAKTLFPLSAGTNQYLDSKKAKAFIKQCYGEAKSRQEFNRLDKEKDVESLVRAEQKNFKITLKQIQVVIKKMYEIERPKSSLIPSEAQMSDPQIPTPADVDLKPSITPEHPRPNPNLLDNDVHSDDRRDYAGFYNRMKEMAADKKMSDKDLKALLANRDRGEKAYDLVSTSYSNMFQWLLKKARMANPDVNEPTEPFVDRLHNGEIDKRKNRHI